MKEIETKYSPIPLELYENYMERLTGRFFKILPLKDGQSITVNSYIESLLNELVGMRDLIIFLENDAQFEILLNTLNGLLINDINYRTEILKCIPIIKSLKVKYCVKGE